MEHSAQVVEQVIRPTGLVDPEIFVRPTDGQIDDLISEINMRTLRAIAYWSQRLQRKWRKI